MKVSNFQQTGDKICSLIPFTLKQTNKTTKIPAPPMYLKFTLKTAEMCVHYIARIFTQHRENNLR